MSEFALALDIQRKLDEGRLGEEEASSNSRWLAMSNLCANVETS